MLGRDGHMPSGRIIRHWVRPRGRCCSGTRRFSQRRKYARIGSEYLFAPIAVETFCPMNTSLSLSVRDLRIVFFVRIESRIESAVYTTQAVTQPDGLQVYGTGL